MILKARLREHTSFIIAEIGFNHGGELNLAIKMIKAAAKSGVDAVKFQTYRASDLVLAQSEHFKLIKPGELSLADHQHLAEIANQNNVAFLSTPFSIYGVDLLEAVKVPAYKIASMDITNLPLLEYVAALEKPVLLSTGMATLSEIARAVETIQQVGNDQIILLHCISKYPADPVDANLHIIPQLSRLFDLPVGYSDHVLGNATAMAAVALGAVVIEKHFTIDKNLPGPDHKISADTQEMTQLVQDIRTIEQSLGQHKVDHTRPDRSFAKLFRRGLFANTDISAGTVITADMIKSVRPAEGLAPEYQSWVIGRTARVAIKKEQPLTWEVL